MLALVGGDRRVTHLVEVAARHGREGVDVDAGSDCGVVRVLGPRLDAAVVEPVEQLVVDPVAPSHGPAPP